MKDNRTIRNALYHNNDRSLSCKVTFSIHMPTVHEHATISSNNFQLSTSFKLQKRPSEILLRPKTLNIFKFIKYFTLWDMYYFQMLQDICSNFYTGNCLSQLADILFLLINA